METERLSIRHAFTNEERLALGEEQAHLLGKKDQLEASLKSAKTQIQAQIDEAEAKIRGVSSKLRDHWEFRDIECLVMDHRINGTRHIVRTDSGHLVKTRHLRPDECQVKLTDQPPASYVAIACLPVDDHAVDADFIELHIFDGEFEVLRKCPDVKLRDVPQALPEHVSKDKGAAKKKRADA